MSIEQARDERCLLSIAIPAKNEERLVGRALEAFARQCDCDGAPLDPRTFEVIVLANDCTDRTREIALDVASRHPHLRAVVRACSLPAGSANVGAARRAALQLAIDRGDAVHARDPWIATTDADSVVDERWVAHTLRERAGVDVVAGWVSVGDCERALMQAPLRLLYDRELSYRRAMGSISAWLDPQPHDPPGRHDSFVGASLAIRVHAYRAVGGLAPLPCLEDVALARSLALIDAKTRHTYDVRVSTSARRLARVEGGFATFIDDLRSRGERRESFEVEAGARTVRRTLARAALRRLWRGGSENVSAVAVRYGVREASVRVALAESESFGLALAGLESAAPFELLPDEPVEDAIAMLAAALTSAIPNAAIRASAASGAG